MIRHVLYNIKTLPKWPDLRFNFNTWPEATFDTIVRACNPKIFHESFMSVNYLWSFKESGRPCRRDFQINDGFYKNKQKID